MSAVQAVHIPSYEERIKPKPHIVYKIEIQANGVRSWTMWRRYSEFDDLHVELVKSTGSPPPHPLPPKHKFSIFRSNLDSHALDVRREGLEAYLRAIIGAKDDKWREAYALKEFLGIPLTRQAAANPPPQSFTISSWLDEHVELQSRIRDVRADINKRDALSDAGDVASSHKSNAGARQKLSGIFSRITKLESGLQDLAMSGLSEGELQRRTDMVTRLRDDGEKLAKMVTVSQFGSRTARGSNAANPSPDTDREVLLGGNSHVTTSKLGRVFGAAPKAVETDETRPLDDHGLVGLQQVQMQRQDQELSQLTAILQRQRQMGEAIGSEIEYQNELLDGLTNDVDRVGGKLSTANRQMNRLGK